MDIQSIIVDQKYFENIKTAVTAINEFFASSCVKKNFPSDDVIESLPSFFGRIFNIFNNVEPTWVTDASKVDASLQFIEAELNKMKEPKNDDALASGTDDLGHALIALKSLRALQFIGDNYGEFTSLVQSMYTLELFTKPSLYKNAINTFEDRIRMDILDVMFGKPCYVLADDINMFDMHEYVEDVFNTSLITTPKGMTIDSETNRCIAYTDLTDTDIKVSKTIQEAAEINYFEDKKNPHFKYDKAKDTFKVSTQYTKSVNDFISSLRKCDTTDDLNKLFADENNSDLMRLFAGNVAPFILMNVLNSMKKYPFDNIDPTDIRNYIRSYKSIIDKNNGAKRFFKYDIHTTFKVDKESTINFVKDFLMLDLYNNKAVAITNNTLLTLFNIFDSRIYLDILYNNLDDESKKEKDENTFVKTTRAIINANSRKANAYKTDASDKVKDADTTDAVVEYCNSMLEEFGDMTIQDMTYCEQYSDILYKEASIIDDLIYNAKMSPIQINEYMRSSCEGGLYNFIQEGTTPVESGDIPDYMKNRMNVSDDTASNIRMSDLDIDLPSDVPLNPLDDVLGSIDAKMNLNGNIDEVLGSGYKENYPDTKKLSKEGIVYNITNNYSNSFNKTNNDSSVGKTVNTHHENNNNSKTNSDNNYNNSIKPNDTKDSNDVTSRDKNQILSSGHTIQEAFAFLESEEPLSNDNDAGKPPKGDLLTTAMDADRKTLGAQQSAKKAVQKVVNTGKAITKPFARTKQWMTRIIDSLIKRDEDKVKAEIIENPSYRTALYKAGRIALKLGLTGISFTISGYLSAAYVVVQGAKFADKQRLKKEVQEEFATEIEILNTKIEQASRSDKPADRKAMYQMMRLRSKMENVVATSPRSTIKRPSSIY